MKLYSFKRIVAGLGLGLMALPAMRAATVLSLGEGWFKKSGTAATVVVDARFTGGAALSYTTTASNVPLFGSFGDTFRLAEVGDYITVSFEFLSTTGNPFVFGLVSKDAGTGSTDAIAADGAIGFSDHGAYYARVPMGSASFTRVYKDAGTAGTGLMAGSDVTAVGTDGANANFASSSVRTASFTVMRTETGTSIGYSVAGSVVLTRVDASGAFTSFDGLGFNHYNSSIGLLIGNVQVDGVYAASAIPEPGACAAIAGALGLLAVAMRRSAVRGHR